MAISDGTPRRSTRGEKLLVLLIGILVLGHSFLVTLWAAPENPIRQSVGESRLSAYIDPYFQQSWASFDPTLERVDENFRIRAYIQDSGTGSKDATEWIDVTELDDRATRYDLNPSRVHLIGHRLATNLNDAMYSLNAEQQGMVGEDNTGSSTTRLANGLTGAADSTSTGLAAERYLRDDEMAVRYASMYATAQWGSQGKILQIQYSIGHRTVPDFEERASTSLADVQFNYFTFGWRTSFFANEDAQSAFDSYVGR